MDIKATGETENPLKDRLRHMALPIVVFVVPMVLGEGIVRILEVPAYISPPPSEVAKALATGFLSGVFLPDLAVTAFESIFGFAIGSLFGLVFGKIIVFFPTMERIIYLYVVAIQPDLKAAITPLFVVWFGFGLTSKIVVVALA